MIQIDGIKRQYGPRIVLDGLSWTIRPAARIGLVGPNGAGKSTLMRIVCGRESADAGAVHRSGRLQVAYLPQEVESIDSGTVLEVVLGGFDEIVQLERELELVADRLGRLAPDDLSTPRLTARYGELRHRFEALGGDRLEARAKTILSGLGVPLSSFHEPVEILSGGWRMRVVLARLLLGEPDLLLLDEPTNHLDLEAIGWLEGFLESFPGAFVVVSHDRYFLNRMAREIAELEHGKLVGYPGSYDEYLQAKQKREESLEDAARRQAREVAKVERFIERFRYKNTKARQVQSRIRSLDKLERVQSSARARGVRFQFPSAPRSGEVVVRAEKVDKRFGATAVYREMNLLLRRGERVALVGPNGAGKSTLLKMLAGKIPVDGGRLELGHNVSYHYYAQHQLEALNAEASPLEELESIAAPDDRPRLRNLLGCFLFHGTDVDKPIGVLSGGEKARLALAKMLLRPANLLLLDEPTNHLDLRSREVLEDALNDYEGSLIVISHDRYFINRVATRVGVVGGGRIELHEGDYDEYISWRERREREASESEEPRPSLSGASMPPRRIAKRVEAEARNRRYRERQAIESRLKPVEEEIAELERRGKELERLRADPALYREPERAREVGREKAEIDERLDQLYVEWESLGSALESEAD